MSTLLSSTSASTPSVPVATVLPVGIAAGNNGAHSKVALSQARKAAPVVPLAKTAKPAVAVKVAKGKANARAGATANKLSRATLPATTKLVPCKGAQNVARPGTVRHYGIACALKGGTLATWCKAMAANAKVHGCKQASQAPGTWLRWLVANKYITLA